MSISRRHVPDRIIRRRRRLSRANLVRRPPAAPAALPVATRSTAEIVHLGDLLWIDVHPCIDRPGRRSRTMTISSGLEHHAHRTRPHGPPTATRLLRRGAYARPRRSRRAQIAGRYRVADGVARLRYLPGLDSALVPGGDPGRRVRRANVRADGNSRARRRWGTSWGQISIF